MYEGRSGKDLKDTYTNPRRKAELTPIAWISTWKKIDLGELKKREDQEVRKSNSTVESDRYSTSIIIKTIFILLSDGNIS